MFRLENFYKEIPLLERHHKYMEEKKQKEHTMKMLKTGAVLLTTAGVALLAYKYSGWKNLLKGHYGEL